MLREEGTDGARYALWDATGWHRDYSPPAWRSRATAEQKRTGWEMAVRIEKILCAMLHETHKRQVEETMDALAEGPEDMYRRPYISWGVSALRRCTALGGGLCAGVAHAEEFHGPGHVSRLSNMVAHDARKSSPVRLRPAIGDQLVVDLPREREVRHAGVVDVPELPTAEPVDGSGWNPKPALALGRLLLSPC